ncbi:hypothetical protein TNCV_2219941 [Trichonephila clavipes]|nr:hypothetical protein TNCV_2219941 [Trichonephila clavipes]
MLRFKIQRLKLSFCNCQRSMENGKYGPTPMVRAVVIDGKIGIRIGDHPKGTQMSLRSFEALQIDNWMQGKMPMEAFPNLHLGPLSLGVTDSPEKSNRYRSGYANRGYENQLVKRNRGSRRN